MHGNGMQRVASLSRRSIGYARHALPGIPNPAVDNMMAGTRPTRPWIIGWLAQRHTPSRSNSSHTTPHPRPEKSIGEWGGGGRMRCSGPARGVARRLAGGSAWRLRGAASVERRLELEVLTTAHRGAHHSASVERRLELEHVDAREARRAVVSARHGARGQLVG